jgi:hypothetical protein
MEGLHNFSAKSAYMCVGIHETERNYRVRLGFLYKYEYILTHGAANCAATQEIPSILWNPEVHHRVHKSPPLVSILNQNNPIYTIPFYLSKIHLNNVHPSTFWSSQWSLTFWLSHQYPICIPLLP